MNDGSLGTALCRAYNNWVAKLVCGHEDRLWPVAMIPAGCPRTCPPSSDAASQDLGFKAAHLVPYCGLRNLNDPAFFPYYATAQELDVPLLCHPVTNGILADRFDSFFRHARDGQTIQQHHGIGSSSMRRRLRDVPRLRVAFFECSAEWIIYWMHRMDDDYEAYKNFEAKHLTMRPSEYIRRNCYVTCEADERLLATAIQEIGDARICLATDYPHTDSEFPYTVAKIKERSDIGESQKQLILGENAARLLNL